jgi:hypothetical protein
MPVSLAVSRCPRLLAVLLIELAIILLGTTSIGCRVAISDQRPLMIISAKEFENRAIERARSWKPDAFLSSLSISRPIIDSSTKLANNPVVYFTFRSREDFSEVLLIEFQSDEKTVVGKLPEFSPYRNYVPIESGDWPIDSKDAWPIAWVHGAHAFFLKYPTATNDTIMKLERWEPPRTGPVRWYVLLNNTSNHESLRLFVDGKTGEVVLPE